MSEKRDTHVRVALTKEEANKLDTYCVQTGAKRAGALRLAMRKHIYPIVDGLEKLTQNL